MLFTFGGLPHYYNYVLSRLHARVDITVCVPKKSEATLGKGVHQAKDGIDFKVIETEETNGWWQKPTLRSLRSIIAKEEPDAIVFVWPYVLQLIFQPRTLSLIRKRGIKLIYKDIPFNLPKYDEAIHFYQNELKTEDNAKTRGGFYWKFYYLFFRQLVKYYLRLMDAHVYYTEAAHDIIPTYGVNPDRIFIIYNSPDTDRLFSIKKRSISLEPLLMSNGKRVLHVGRLVKWKNVDVLIKAFATLLKNHPTSELLIVGDGPEKQSLELLVDELNLRDHVIFRGAVYDPEELGRCFMESAVYVLAGAGGLSINEAMLYGKPVICSEADGTEKKLVRQNENGYYFELGNDLDLAEKISYLLERPDLIQQFGRKSLDIIQNEVNIHTVINGYMKAFRYVYKGEIKVKS